MKNVIKILTYLSIGIMGAIIAYFTIWMTVYIPIKGMLDDPDRKIFFWIVAIIEFLTLLAFVYIFTFFKNKKDQLVKNSFKEWIEIVGLLIGYIVIAFWLSGIIYFIYLLPLEIDIIIAVLVIIIIVNPEGFFKALGDTIDWHYDPRNPHGYWRRNS